MDSLTSYITSSPLLYNAILLSPLLLLSGLISYVYTNRSYLRTGAGLQPQPPVVDLPPPLVESTAPPNPTVEDYDSEGGEDEEDADEEEEMRIRAFLREAGLDPDEELQRLIDEENAANGGAQEEEEEHDAGVGPANAAPPNRDLVNPPPQAPRARARTGPVGKKKARSLEQRDQRRAYFEFLRTQQRERISEMEAKDAAISAEIFENKQRRALKEEDLLAKKKRAIEARRAEEEFRGFLRGYFAEKVPVGTKVDMNEVRKDILRHDVGKDLLKDDKDGKWFVGFMDEEKLCGVVREDRQGQAYIAKLTEDGRSFVKVGTVQVEDLLKELDKQETMTLEQVGESLSHSLRPFKGISETFRVYLDERQAS